MNMLTRAVLPIVLMVLNITVFSLLARANTEDDINELREQLEQLEESLGDVTGSRALIKAFDGIKVDLGGFLHTAYTYVDAENESAGSFNRQNFES